MKLSLPQSLLVTALALPLSSAVLGDEPQADDDVFKMAAIEALIAAPSERAVPILTEVLRGDGSNELKARALFVLTQSDSPAVGQTLLEYARDSDGPLQLEAIRMIGVHGEEGLLDQLMPVYKNGNEVVRQHILQAFMISGRADPVLQIARDAQSDEEFDMAVRMLGVMGATDMLKELHDNEKASAGLVQAYAIAGDTESLTAMALDDSNKARQLRAIQGLGIADGDDAATTLMKIFRESNDPEVREAAMQGLMIAGAHEALLTLFRNSTDPKDKAMLLRQLVLADSDAALEAVEAALSEKQ